MVKIEQVPHREKQFLHNFLQSKQDPLYKQQTQLFVPS